MERLGQSVTLVKRPVFRIDLIEATRSQRRHRRFRDQRKSLAFRAFHVNNYLLTREKNPEGASNSKPVGDTSTTICELNRTPLHQHRATRSVRGQFPVDLRVFTPW
ncbi:hypothetical protein AVEN_152062-1 [Araneus ventricosus]|uniref:Uncharacterized protein n=1 Tax=Araneus ventricosus TaxID=182803 RepID=A0A4Y2N9J8_ARAVE|nr:hypothetical protein AVEN_152062-1 [Araneus ventricosus]